VSIIEAPNSTIVEYLSLYKLEDSYAHHRGKWLLGSIVVDHSLAGPIGNSSFVADPRASSAEVEQCSPEGPEFAWLT
jgi:hypothetical protein